MELQISYAGKKRVNAQVEGHTILTDQSVEEGGENSAPSPLQYCLASLGTCAAVYVLAYLEARELPSQGVKIIQTQVFDEKLHRITAVKMDIQLPPGIPEKHKKAIVRSAQLCTVKKLFENPPAFEVIASSV